MTFVLEYTKRDGERVTNQLVTAEHLTKIVNNLIEWGCSKIEIRSIDKEA